MKKSFAFYIATVLAAVFALFASPAFGATLEAHDPLGNWVRVSDAPCTNAAVLEHIVLVAPPELHALFKAGTAQIEGQAHALCAVLIPDTPIMGIVLENGNVFMVPSEMFVPAAE